MLNVPDSKRCGLRKRPISLNEKVERALLKKPHLALGPDQPVVNNPEFHDVNNAVDGIDDSSDSVDDIEASYDGGTDEDYDPGDEVMEDDLEAIEDMDQHGAVEHEHIYINQRDGSGEEINQERAVDQDGHRQENQDDGEHPDHDSEHRPFPNKLIGMIYLWWRRVAISDPCLKGVLEIFAELDPTSMKGYGDVKQFKALNKRFPVQVPEKVEVEQTRTYRKKKEVVTKKIVVDYYSLIEHSRRILKSPLARYLRWGIEEADVVTEFNQSKYNREMLLSGPIALHFWKSGVDGRPAVRYLVGDIVLLENNKIARIEAIRYCERYVNKHSLFFITGRSLWTRSSVRWVQKSR
jgi:hypothetical protein